MPTKKKNHMHKSIRPFELYIIISPPPFPSPWVDSLHRLHLSMDMVDEIRIAHPPHGAVFVQKLAKVGVVGVALANDVQPLVRVAAFAESVDHGFDALSQRVVANAQAQLQVEIERKSTSKSVHTSTYIIRCTLALCLLHSLPFPLPPSPVSSHSLDDLHQLRIRCS